MHQMLLGIVSYLDWITGMTQLVKIQIGIVVVSATWSHAALLGDPVQILSCLRFHSLLSPLAILDTWTSDIPNSWARIFNFSPLSLLSLMF